MRSEKDPKNLRSGFTTGTCAAGAAKAAAIMLRDGNVIHEISVKTPKGPVMTAEVLDITRGECSVKCAVRKDAGDDPDVTNGALVYAEVTLAGTQENYTEKNIPGGERSIEGGSSAVADSSSAGDSCGGIEIDGGVGIGRVTKPGLDQPIGNAAINSTPRRMIREAVREVYPTGRVKVIISIPSGVELASRTFNPKLGIVGGISVLGTSGIVKPMSDEAIVATIRVEINVRKAEGYTAVLAAPGNYGLNFLEETYRAPAEVVVSSSNFICDTVQLAAKAGFRRLLFVGHVGKMIKVAGGIRNTHSRYGDHRMEIVSAIAGEMWDQEQSGGHGGKSERNRSDDERNGMRQSGDGCESAAARKAAMLEELSSAVMMDEAVRILKKYGLAEQTFSEAARRVKAYMESWAHEADAAVRVETILFGGDGILAKTGGAEELLWYILSERDRVQSTSLQ